MKVVLKLTGKVFSEEYITTLKTIANTIKFMHEKGYRVVVVTGGGKLAREYISLGRKLGLNNSRLDVIGIETSRINALILASLLGDSCYAPIPRNIDEFMRAWSSNRIVVLGGLQPAQSTNAVAAIIAELISADLLINATVVDGVYDKDPSKYADAKLLSEVSIEELEKMLSQEFLPGHYELIDPLALNIIRRSRINIVFTNAFKPENIAKILKGERVGTWIKW